MSDTASNIVHLPSSTALPAACREIDHGFDPTLPHIVVHCHSQKCLTCSHTSRWSKTYECITKGKTRHYLPCRSPSAIPVDYYVLPTLLPTEYTPICYSCAGTRAEPDIEAHRKWQETLMRKSAQAAVDTAIQSSAEGRNPGSNRAVPSLDDL